MRPIDADELEELFREVISGIAKKPEMNGNLEHMIRASAMVIEMIHDAPTVGPVLKWNKFRQEQDEETGRWLLTRPLPEDGQNILVTVDMKGHEPVQTDIFCNDGCECYLDSGYELITESVAWASMPEPYKEG